MRFIDIAVNLTDDMFQGKYRGKQLHEPDLVAVLERSKAAGVETMMITGTSLRESKDALEMAARYDLYATVGCHPTSTKEITKRSTVDEYFAELEAVIKHEVEKAASSRLVAIGEIGLDYDRLHHSDADTQKAYFPRLLSLGETYSLPLFLHSRHPDAHGDLVKTLRGAGWQEGLEPVQGEDPNVRVPRGRLGVVHSFTGTVEEMRELLGFGLYIGVNGCSLKTEENLQVISQIPLSRLMLETDAPWCSVTGTSASAKHLPPAGHALAQVPKSKSYKPGQGIKGRNEPADVTAIAYVVAQAMGEPVELVAQAASENTAKVFFPHRKDWL